ncbi:phosphatase PAP2 family protein [Aerolutibacter ruishenii]|nr:phosphatase PAP2 family protein [Lysobacter ruishenii]
MHSSPFQPQAARGAQAGWRLPFLGRRDPRLEVAVAHAIGGELPPHARRLPWPELWVPWLVGIVLLVLMVVADVDFRWADQLYGLQGQHWALKSAFVTEDLLHRMGRDLSAAAWLAVAVAWVLSWRRPHMGAQRRALALLALSVLLATGLVAWIKSWSNMDCPWDLLRYGGQRPFVALWEARPAALGHNRCFPAGHASAGYAWMALYFHALAVRPAWRWLGLGVGVAAGLVFGLSQQLRGAHFLSHDVWTALLCWTVAVVAWRIGHRREGRA